MAFLKITEKSGDVRWFNLDSVVEIWAGLAEDGKLHAMLCYLARKHEFKDEDQARQLIEQVMALQAVPDGDHAAALPTRQPAAALAHEPPVPAPNFQRDHQPVAQPRK